MTTPLTATAESGTCAGTVKRSTGSICCRDGAVDPASVDLSSQLLDLKLKYPIMIAPTATQVALHPDGESGMYRAASLSANTPMCLSNNSSQSVEQVAKAAQGQLWWQFYPRQDMAASRELLERAQAAGYTAIVVTVDQQASYYERSQHDRNLGGRGAGRAGRSRSRCWRSRPNDPEAVGTAAIGRGARSSSLRCGSHQRSPWCSTVPDQRRTLVVHVAVSGRDQEVHQGSDRHQGHRDA